MGPMPLMVVLGTTSFAARRCTLSFRLGTASARCLLPWECLITQVAAGGDKKGCAAEVTDEFDRNGFDVRQASKRGDDEYLLLVSQIKTR